MRWPMPKLDDGKCTPCGEKTSGPTPEGVKDGVAHARTHAVRPREQPVVEFRDSTKGAHNSLYLRTGREPCVGLVRLSVVGTFMFPLPFDNVKAWREPKRSPIWRSRPVQGAECGL